MAKKAVQFKAVCVNCGVFIPDNSGAVKSGKNYCSNCASIEETAVLCKPREAGFKTPTGILKAVCYVLSLLPVVGFILGAVFYPQEDPAVKKFGRDCFIMMAIGFFIGIVFFFLMMAAGVALGGAFGGAMDKFNFGEGYF